MSQLPDNIKDYESYQSLLGLSSKSRSLLKTSLTRDIFDNLRNRKTSFGGTLTLLIRSGVKNPDSSIGIYATDPEAYQTFSALLSVVISEYHGVSVKTIQPQSYFGEPEKFYDLDPLKKFVISTRIRCARSLRGYPFHPLLAKQQYLEIEKKITNAIQSSSTLRRGTYRPLASMSTEERTDLIKQHYLFADIDRFLGAAGGDRFWPEGRGIYYNADKTVLLWVNEEDHLRIISMQDGADISHIYKRLIEAVNGLTSQLDFEHSDKYGYLTFCPTNIGTTIRASVLIRLPRLGEHESILRAIAKSLDVQVRGTHGEHSAIDDHTFEISNEKRFGITEFDAVKNLHDGVKQLIRIELAME